MAVESAAPVLQTNITTEDSISRLIYDIHLLLARGFNRRVRHMGLTRPQWEVVTLLRRLDGATQTELAETLEMGRSPLGKIIDKLEAMELVERRADEDDRRINRVFLTEKMQPLIEPIRDVTTALQELAFEGVSIEEERGLMFGLQKIRDNLHNSGS